LENFLTKNEQTPGLPDSLFALSDPVHAATLMQLEAKHRCFLRQLNDAVNPCVADLPVCSWIALPANIEKDTVCPNHCDCQLNLTV
jgi:hypothetical protein